MINLKSFTFNPFQENTFVLSDETGECVIIDPGCNDEYEKQELDQYIESNQLISQGGVDSLVLLKLLELLLQFASIQEATVCVDRLFFGILGRRRTISLFFG